MEPATKWSRAGSGTLWGSIGSRRVTNYGSRTTAGIGWGIINRRTSSITRRSPECILAIPIAMEGLYRIRNLAANMLAVNLLRRQSLLDRMWLHWACAFTLERCFL